MAQLNENPNWDGKLNPDADYIVESGSSNVLQISMKGWQIMACYHPGPCDEDVKRIMALPEVKAELDQISEKEIREWWSEFFCDDTPEEHASATLADMYQWFVFDACASAVDGYCTEAE